MKLFGFNTNSTANRQLLFKNVSWSVIGRVVQIVNALLIGVIIARYLKPDQYGMLNYAAGYVAMFSLLTEFGIADILIRELAKKSTDKNVLIGSATFIRMVLSLFTIGFIFVSLQVSKEDPMMRNLILINSLNYVFLPIVSTFHDYFTSQLQNDKNVKSEVFRVAIMAVLKLFFVFIKAPLFVFVVLAAMESFILLFYYIPVFKKSYGALSQLSISWTCIKALLFSSAPILLEGLTGMIYQRLDVVMTGKFINPEAVAYYSIALKFVDFAVFIPLVLVQTFSPMLTRKFEEAHYNRFDPKYVEFKNKVGDITAYSGVFITIALIIGAFPVISILYGKDYSQSIPLLQIMAFKGIFCGIAYPVSIIIVTEGRQKWAFLTNVIGAIAYLGLSFYLIPTYGLFGVAWSTLIAFIIGAYFSNLMIPLYQIDFRFQTGFIFKGPKRILGYLKS